PETETHGPSQHTGRIAPGTKPTLEAAGVLLRPRDEPRAAGVLSRPRGEPLAWSERPLCSSCGSSASPWSTDAAWAPAWGGAALRGCVARVPDSGTQGSANLPDTSLGTLPDVLRSTTAVAGRDRLVPTCGLSLRRFDVSLSVCPYRRSFPSWGRLYISRSPYRDT